MNMPKVFISYTHDSEQHKEWVRKLYNDLTSEGLDVILDQEELSPGEDLFLFMEQSVSQSDFILCICSDKYVKSVNERRGGSGYEARMMTPILQTQKYDQIIPVIRNNSGPDKTPHFLSSKLYIDFCNDDEYEKKCKELVDSIKNRRQKKKLQIEKISSGDEVSRQIDIQTKLAPSQYHSPALAGTVEFRFDNNDGKYTIGTGEYAFETKWSRAGNNSIHAYGTIGFNYEFTVFPSGGQIEDFDFSSRVRTIRTGQILIVKNSYNNFAAIKLGEVNSSIHGHPYDKMTFDYHIYTVQ